MLQVFLVLVALAGGHVTVRDGYPHSGVSKVSQGKKLGSGAGSEKKKGQVVTVKGPCGKRPCCTPIKLTLPETLEPKVLSPGMAIKLTVAPDGNVREVKIIKSSGIADVDRQLLEGARRWCMEKTKEGREVHFAINLDVR